MGTLEMPVWMDNGGAYAAGMDRAVLWGAMPVPGVFAQDTTTTALGQEGIVAQRGAGANLSVDISPARIVVGESGTTNASWRNYLCKHSGAAGAVTNLVMPAAPSGGNPRYDAVCALVNDSTITSGNSWVFDVVQGTAAATPAYPAITGMRTVLAMVLRDNLQTTITSNKIVNCANRLWYEGGTRIAYVKYNPGTLTSPTSTSTTYVPIVAGGAGVTGGWNVTFTAPPTGKVKAVVELYAGFLTARTGNSGVADQNGLYLSMVDANNNTPAGANYAMTHWNDGNFGGTVDAAGVHPQRRHYEARITGLTPGNVYTWWPAWRRGDVFGSGTLTAQVSNANGDFWCAIYADA